MKYIMILYYPFLFESSTLSSIIERDYINKETSMSPLVGIKVMLVDDEESILQFLELGLRDRKSTRLNSSHVKISYAVFCLKKKNTFPLLDRRQPIQKVYIGIRASHLGVWLMCPK